MDLHRIALCLVCLMIAVVSWTCVKSNQLAATMIYDAKAQINAADQEQAAKFAPKQLTEAKDYINKAKIAFKDNSQESYRLAKRAYLKAQYAEILAKRNKAERMADIEEAKLEKILREVEKARRAQEAAEQELKDLSKSQ